MLFYSDFQFLQEGFYDAEFNCDQEHQHEHFHHQQQKQFIVKNTYENGNHMVDYLLNNPIQHLPSDGFCSSNSIDKLNFADVMQFADLEPKMALNHKNHENDEDQGTGIDPIYFLKSPVLNDRVEGDNQSLLAPFQDDEQHEHRVVIKGGEREEVRLQFTGEDGHKTLGADGKKKRKRPRTLKSSEEVETQRMTHIAVERNRRKQINEHLRVLRSLMPGSYVQRGDQASIIGGAIEFVRELEQLLQCLESQKRRRLYVDTPLDTVFYAPPDDQMKEEMVESKSCLADIEVRLLGFDAMIKILCTRRRGQLIKIISALEDLQFNILHTNITTIDQTVLYSFNVKVSSEARLSAEGIGNSVQQIISFVQANSNT